MDIRQKSIEKAIKYIEKNLNEQLDLNAIAKVASYSPYHFSRVFKQTTGENINNMIKRLRLSQSTHKLMYQKSAVTQIGLNIGYETPSSFNKAFKQLFGMSPTKYKEKTKLNLEKYIQDLQTHPEIINIPNDIIVLSERFLGEYNDAAICAWNNIIKTVDSNKNHIVFDKKRYFGLCFDNPQITRYNQMRYEACITLNEKEAKYIRKTKILPKGQYAILNHEGNYDDLYDVWLQFYSWIYNQNLQLDNVPPIEEYLESPKDILQGKVIKGTTYLMLKLL